MKIGIVGYGSFGSFAAKVLSPYAKIYIYDKDTSVSTITLNELGAMDAVLLAVPLNSYKDVLQSLKPLLKPDTLVIDICSVKVPSRDAVLEVLPNHPNILIAHPLFGPQSAAKGARGHDMIVTDVIGDKAKACVTLFKQVMGLKIHTMTAEEHDKAMAYLHVLTFFIARGLSDMKLPDISFKTPSFSILQELIDLDHLQSNELFSTIQKGNPYGQEVRKDFISKLTSLEESLGS